MKRPNRYSLLERRSVGCQMGRLLPLLYLLLLSSEIEANEQHQLGRPQTSNQSEASPSQNLEVKNLRLTSDFRAVKLQWTFERANASEVEPSAFNIRYCELTSWNIEIKCRSRDMPVVGFNGNNNNSVIGNSSVDLVRQLEPNGAQYEAHIFDLRALTNYTFQVRASREGQPSSGEPVKLRSQSGRRLDEAPPLSSRVETKAFGAEATKCLADVSELVINTGRHFGGRISVEDSTDPRCHLLGNRSSEQSSYTFRIDHQICHSKVRDEHRIETMILVHENKDILTHNTARFLVICNFQQRSFTLKASVSLAKVNGKMAPSGKPASITALAGRPGEEHATAVMLGSMPGVYRARNSLEKVSSGNGGAAELQSDVNGADELEQSNTIERFRLGKEPRSSNETLASRRSKELQTEQQQPRARSLTLDDSLTRARLPEPVQVQSKVLYVDRAVEPGLLRNARRRNHNGSQLAQSAERGGQTEAGVTTARIQRQSSPDEPQDMLTPPIIITNNHRISADHLPVTQAGDSNGSPGFRYSAAKVDEFSLGHVHQPTPGATGRAKLRSRHGRMRAVDSASADEPTTSKPGDVPSDWAMAINRMGDAPSTNDFDPDPAELPLVNSSLARNITSYLLKWSLKTLTNLAKKSLDTLLTPSVDDPLTDLSPTNFSTKAARDPPMSVAKLNSTAQLGNAEAVTNPSSSIDRRPVESATGGFIAGSSSEITARPEFRSGRTTAKPEVSHLANRTRPSERSGRAGSQDARLRTGSRPDEDLASSRQHRPDNGETSHYGAWLLYAIGALVSLITAVFLTLWLISTATSNGRSLNRDQVSSEREDPAQTKASFTTTDESSINKYQSFRGGTPTSSRSTRSTRSTSVGSGSLSDENDCKNQEYLYTEHVLINTGSSLGESFA